MDSEGKCVVKSKNKYILNGRFFMMSLIISYATRRYRDAIRDALQLITNEPAAVCTPAVKEIIYSLYEDDIAIRNTIADFKRANR